MTQCNCESKGCRILVRAIKFMLHFGAVMAILFGGAIVFSYLEDPAPDPNYMKPEVKVMTPIFDSNSTVTKYNFSSPNQTAVWKALQHKYGFHSMNDSALSTFFADISLHVEEVKKEEKRQSIEEERKDRFHIFRKWFYFANIAMTTIGMYATFTFNPLAFTSVASFEVLIYSEDFFGTAILYNFVYNCRDMTNWDNINLLYIYLVIILFRFHHSHDGNI